jgi:UPF0271 protein
MAKLIDLNADAGESFGHWKVANEEALFPHLTSVNLACGFHASDPVTMQTSVALAKRLGVAVGAHPGFMDKAGFGRRDIAASAKELYTDTLYQMGALQAFLEVEGLSMHHMKAHGALYFKMMYTFDSALAVTEAVAAFKPGLPIVILAGSGGELMQKAADELKVRAVAEAFPDRGYLANGQLAPRTMQGAVLNEPELIAERAVALATGQALKALDGGTVQMSAQTLCLHGDNSNSALTAATVRQALSNAGVEVKAF